jgi:hypothetical protein
MFSLYSGRKHADRFRPVRTLSARPEVQEETARSDGRKLPERNLPI